jgi:Zn-finger nucleic acid-binding protein
MAPSCPTCRVALIEAGRTLRCATCDGAWIAEEVLVGMLQERASMLVELAWQARPDDAARPCAECGAPMQTANLGSVALDRCASHGAWFDAGELAALLAQAGQFKADATAGSEPASGHRGLLGALARLFGG